MVTVDFDVDWPRAAWIGFGVVLGLLTLWVVWQFVGTFVFGLFIYYATRKVYRRVREYVDQPSVAAGLSLGLVALPGLALLYYALAIALQEFDRFVDTVRSDTTGPLLGRMVEMVEPFLRVAELVEDPFSLVQSAGGFGTLTESLSVLLGYIGVVGNGLLHVFLMFALAFYLLRDAPKMRAWAGSFTDAHGVFDTYLHTIDESLDAIFYGTLLNAIIAGTLGAILFSLLNVVAPPGLAIPYPALLGFLAGLASLVPVVGMKLVYVPVAAYLGVLAVVDGQGYWFVVLFTGVAFVIVDAIPDFIVRPYVSRGTLHAGALMFAYIFGPLLFGWYGIFLGPILYVLIYHFAKIVFPELVSGERIRPYSVDPSNVVGEPGSAGSPEEDEAGDGA